DPLIIGSHFHPLFERFRFLYLLYPESKFEEASTAVDELLKFVKALKMGDYYSKRLDELLGWHFAGVGWLSTESEYERKRKVEERWQGYLQQFKDNFDEAERLLIEMLRYQDWPLPAEFRKRD